MRDRKLFLNVDLYTRQHPHPPSEKSPKIPKNPQNGEPHVKKGGVTKITERRELDKLEMESSSGRSRLTDSSCAAANEDNAKWKLGSVQ